MQKLRAKLTIGISYKDYESDVASIYADVSVFVQSPEGKELPELATLFNNASGCYLKVREIWGRSFEGGQASFLSPREQAQYSSFMAEAFAGGGPKPIWDTASVNIDLAAQLVNNAPESLDSVRHAMEEKSSKLSVSSIEIKLPTVP
jgi:hypothetical protein